MNPLSPFQLENGLVKVGVNAQGGYLDPVSFLTARGEISPMHRAPWLTKKLPVKLPENLPKEIPPMLRAQCGEAGLPCL